MDLKLTTDATLEAVLSPLVITRQDLKARIAALESQVDSINDDIKTTLANAGITEIEVENHKITLNLASERSTLDKRKLLEQGVTTDQIKAATNITTSVLLNVRPIKEKA
jgi:uncharacterized protein YwgA